MFFEVLPKISYDLHCCCCLENSNSSCSNNSNSNSNNSSSWFAASEKSRFDIIIKVGQTATLLDDVTSRLFTSLASIHLSPFEDFFLSLFPLSDFYLVSDSLVQSLSSVGWQLYLVCLHLLYSLQLWLLSHLRYLSFSLSVFLSYSTDICLISEYLSFSPTRLSHLYPLLFLTLPLLFILLFGSLELEVSLVYLPLC